MFSKHQSHLTEKCRNAVHALKSYIKNAVGELQLYLAIKMFDSQISPIMEKFGLKIKHHTSLKKFIYNILNL